MGTMRSALAWNAPARRFFLSAGIFALVGVTGQANAAAPTLLDPGFELYVQGSTTQLANDDRSLGNGAGGQENQTAEFAVEGGDSGEPVHTLPGWTVTPPGPTPPATTDRFRDDKEFVPAARGDFMGGIVGASGTFDQDMGVAAVPNATYTLGIQVIDRNSVPAFGGTDVVGIHPTLGLRLFAGSTDLGGVGTFVPPPGSGDIGSYTLVVTTGSTVPSGNLKFEVFASGNSGQAATQTFFDNATIAFVPEPSSLALLGLVSLAGLSRRRHR
jgi:hypothetical protein